MDVLERLLPKVGDLMHGRYRLESELGRGGFGIVYKALQTSLDRRVAVKILLPHILSNQDLVDRFIREVGVVKELRHPHTIGILEFGRTSAGLPFYVMEYVKGTPLDELLKAEGSLGELRTQHIIVQVLKSLAEAHSMGIIHRDLKPANLMICEVFGETDYVKVLDFGIAKALAVDGSGLKTQTGMILGSPPYMSPEQAFGKESPDGRSDLYSVGLIMAECVSGRRVVEAQSMMQVLAMHISKEPLPFNDAVRQSALWPIIERATHKDRDLRWGSAAEMRHALEVLGAALSSGTAFPAAGFGQVPVQTPYPTPYPTGPQSTPTPSPQPMPAPQAPQATPTPTPAPLSGPHGAQLVAGPVQAPIAAPDAPVDPGAATESVEPHPISRGLMVALLVLFVSGAALAFVITRGGGEEGTSAGSATPTDDDGTELTDNTGSDGETQGPGTSGPLTTDGPGTEGPGGPTGGPGSEGPGGQTDGPGGPISAVTGPDRTGDGTDVDHDSTVDEWEQLALLVEGFGAAGEALRLAVPGTRQITFEGTQDADILVDGQVVGRTPEPLTVPALDVDIELRFERSGYQARTEAVNLATTERVRVRLRRERDTTVETDTGTGTETETGPGPIPGVTIHR